MRMIIKPIRAWFGYTRREKRSSFLLLIIIIIVIAFRYLVPQRNICIEEIEVSIPGTGLQAVDRSVDARNGELSFSFDPNEASYNDLINIGFTGREANTLINYREKGGLFLAPADIKKVYGLDPDKAEKIIPLVEIGGDKFEQVRVKSFEQPERLIDINLCDSSSLVALPGIGPVLSARIIKYRKLLGGYARKDQLKEVYGLPEETYELIKGRVFADSSAVTITNINSAGFRELLRIPYFTKYEVNSILKYREVKGRIKSIKNLSDNKLISVEKADKVRPYLSFD